MRVEGELLSECADTGLGYKWAGSALGDLQHHHPSTGDKCEHFQVGQHRRLVPLLSPHHEGVASLQVMITQNGI